MIHSLRQSTDVDDHRRLVSSTAMAEYRFQPAGSRTCFLTVVLRDAGLD